MEDYSGRKVERETGRVRKERETGRETPREGSRERKTRKEI